MQIEYGDKVSIKVCGDCQKGIKFAYRIRVALIEAISQPKVKRSTEVYKIIDPENDEVTLISAEHGESHATLKPDDEINDSEPMNIIIMDDYDIVTSTLPRTNEDEVTENEESDEKGKTISLKSGDQLRFKSDSVDSIDIEPLQFTEDGDPIDAVTFLMGNKQLFDDREEKSATMKRPHVCQVCNKSFVRKSNLVDHLRLHANVRLFKCSFCDKSFVQAGNYRSHLRIHTKERPYACSMCPKTYNQSSALKVHIRSHTNERNYVCTVCSKGFTNSSDLNKHKRLHDPSQKIKCDYCDKTFAQKVNLKNHIFRHHNTSQSKSKFRSKRK